MVKLLTDSIAAHQFTCLRFPGSILIICLIATKYFCPKILKSNDWTTEPFLRHIKLDKIIQIKRLHYAKFCGEKKLFHDLINICPGKSENLKSQESLCIFLLHCFLFRSWSLKLFSKVAVLKFHKTPLETQVMDFCFSCRT